MTMMTETTKMVKRIKAAANITLAVIVAALVTVSVMCCHRGKVISILQSEVTEQSVKTE